MCTITVTFARIITHIIAVEYSYIIISYKRMSYSLHIKADNKRMANIVVTEKGEHIIATRGSSYHLIADNKTDHPVNVALHQDGTYIGAWMLNAHHSLKIDEKVSEKDEYKSTFVFGGVVSHADNENTCEYYDITATFSSARGFAPIDTTVIRIPIQVCDHPVNRV